MKSTRKPTQEAPNRRHRVTDVSSFDDCSWSQTQPKAGQKEQSSILNWTKVKTSDGATLLDEEHKGLLYDFKVLVDNEINAPRGVAPLGPGSMSSKQTSLSILFEWMLEVGIERVGEIDNELSWNYVDWLLTNYNLSDERTPSHIGRKREITATSAHRQILLLERLYEYRGAMRKAGATAMVEAPFDGERSANKIVEESMGLLRGGRLKPIPDEQIIPIVSRALEVIEKLSETTIELQRYALAYATMHGTRRSDGSEAIVVANTAKFHERLSEMSSAASLQDLVPWGLKISGTKEYTPLDGRPTKLEPTQQLRRLILSVLRACAIVTQALTGIRAHELCGIETEDFNPRDMPTCIQVETTDDGLFEIFYVLGATAKRESKKTRWVIGVRPAGDTYLPPVVMALSVAAQLSAPWRKLGKIKNVFVVFSTGIGLPRQSRTVGAMNSMSLTHGQRNFVYDFVDFCELAPTADSKRDLANCLRGHRWRSTFAHHLFRTDSRLVPAIADHFKHVSELMTVRGYIGNDPTLKIAFDAESVQSSVEILLEITTGAQQVAGPLAPIVEQHAASLRDAIESQPGESIQQKAAHFVRTNEIPIWNAPYGSCLMSLMPEKSRCRQVAGEISWANVRPNLAVRTPSMCAGCECLYVRADHEGYWKGKYDELTRCFHEAKKDGRESEYRVIEHRMKIAKHFLDAIAKAKRGKGETHGGKNTDRTDPKRLPRSHRAN